MEEADNIDLSQLERIPTRHTIALVNEHVLNSIDFVNKFSFTSEKKLVEMDFLLYNIDAKLQLLEKKLDSVPPEYYQNLP